METTMSETSLHLSFVAHYHRPPGTPVDEMNQLIDRTCLPQLEALAAVPGACAGLHYSGTMLQWAEEHRPDLIEAIHGMAEQTELVGGAMHDPFLPLIPDQWRRLQIEAHRRLIAELFGREPVGFWLPEEVWEPAMAWLLHDIGAGYIFLDRSRFEEAEAEPGHPALVDHLGRTVRILPLLRAPARRTGTDPVDAVLGRLSHLAAEPAALLAVLAFDASWTADQLRTLLTAVSEAEGIDVVPPSRAAELPARPAALPTHIPPNGPGRAGLLRHSEANVLYRRMLTLAGERLPSEASGRLMAAQAGDVYWAGPDGGILDPRLRAAANEHLLAARRTVDGGRRTRSWTDLRIRDWDADGHEEIVVELPDQSWVLHSDGSFRYYIDKPSSWPVADVAAASPRGPRWWLSDRFATAGAGPSVLEDAPGPASQFELEAGEAARGSVHIKMAAPETGRTLRKEIQARDRTVELTYTLEDFPAGLLGPELPVAVPAGRGRLRIDGGEWLEVDTPLAHTGHRFRFEHIDRGTQILIDLRLPGAIFVAPLVTTVHTALGHTEIQQGLILWPHYLVGGSSTYVMTVSIVDTPEPE